jgi:hypothetical protein
MAAVADFHAKQRHDAEKAAGLHKKPKKQSEFPSEYQEQKLVAQWLGIHKIPYAANLEGVYHGDAIRGAISRAAGAKKGRPDIEVFARVPRHPGARGVALEMKSTRPGAKASPEQLAWLLKLSDCGWVTYVAHGADDAIDWLRSLGFGT